MLDEDEIKTLPIFVLDLFPNDLPVPADLAAVQNRMQMMQYQNRFWAEYGGSAKLAGRHRVDGQSGGDSTLTQSAFEASK
ncbi:MAG: hypothetical protein RL748_3929 [Pseudomonadota bacterium]|jgi:hypothetical protein